MRSSERIQARILDHIRTLSGAVPEAQGLGRNRDRKLRRRRVRFTLVDFILGRAIDAGIIPPAEDAPERDWETFFAALLEFMDGLADIILRLLDAFPAGE